MGKGYRFDTLRPRTFCSAHTVHSWCTDCTENVNEGASHLNSNTPLHKSLNIKPESEHVNPQWHAKSTHTTLYMCVESYKADRPPIRICLCEKNTRPTVRCVRPSTREPSAVAQDTSRMGHHLTPTREGGGVLCMPCVLDDGPRWACSINVKWVWRVYCPM